MLKQKEPLDIYSHSSLKTARKTTNVLVVFMKRTKIIVLFAYLVKYNKNVFNENR